MNLCKGRRCDIWRHPLMVANRQQLCTFHFNTRVLIQHIIGIKYIGGNAKLTRYTHMDWLLRSKKKSRTDGKNAGACCLAGVSLRLLAWFPMIGRFMHGSTQQHISDINTTCSCGQWAGNQKQSSILRSQNHPRSSKINRNEIYKII